MINKQEDDICDYVNDCVSKVTINCIPNYTDCMAYKFYKAKEQGVIEDLFKELEIQGIEENIRKYGDMELR